MNNPTSIEEPRAKDDASAGGPKSTGDPSARADADLQRDVLAEIALEPSVAAEHIGVSVKDGIVVLNGYVNSYVEKFAAEDAVKRVRGVKAVVDEIQIKLLKDRPSDEDIAEEVVRTLRAHLLTASLGIRVTVRDGVVTLEGEVEWQYQKLAAEAAIRHLPGVKGVDNRIEVKPHVEPGETKVLIARALKRNARVDPGRIKIEVDGGKVILRGSVRSLREKERVERVAWRAAGVLTVENQITVEP